MLTLIETYDPSQILQPMQDSRLTALKDAVVFGPNLTVYKGQAVAQKTADKKMYPFVVGNSDGTQLFKGFSIYTFRTDANGQIYLGDNVAAPSARLAPWTTMPIFISGIFNPQDLRTALTPAANVVTFTPTTVTTGDVNTITYTKPTGETAVATFTVGGTATAAAASAGLIAAWNADSYLATIATASGTSTVILTALVAGNDINSFLVGAVTGTGTLPKANTTAATGRVFADILTSRPDAQVLHNGFWRLP